jgi:hypothetical protein
MPAGAEKEKVTLRSYEPPLTPEGGKTRPVVPKKTVSHPFPSARRVLPAVTPISAEVSPSPTPPARVLTKPEREMTMEELDKKLDEILEGTKDQF